MPKCTFCDALTHLYDGGVPICLDCVDRRELKLKSQEPEINVRAKLGDDLVKATKRARLAFESFRAVVGDVPSGLPHPDGTQRIHNASRQLSEARLDLMKAHDRLDDFLRRGIVPEDLKVHAARS